MYPPSEWTVTADASGFGRQRDSTSRIATPSQRLSKRLQCVTQWMSETVSARGSRRNSSQLHEISVSTSPKQRSVQVERSIFGTAP